MRLRKDERCGTGGLYLEFAYGNKALEIHMHKTKPFNTFRVISANGLEYVSFYFIEDLVKFILTGGEV